jgi:hypothetical protein
MTSCAQNLKMRCTYKQEVAAVCEAEDRVQHAAVDLYLAAYPHGVTTQQTNIGKFYRDLGSLTATRNITGNDEF